MSDVLRLDRFSLTRRQLAIGALGMGVGLPLARAGQAVAAQTDLASLGLPAMNVTITADAFNRIPAIVPAGRYLVNVTLADDLDQPGGLAFLRPYGMSANEFLAFIAGPPSAEASPVASPDAEGGGEDEGPLPTFVYQSTWAGGAYAAVGQTASAVVDLTAGEWIAWGDDPSAPQKPVGFLVTGEFPAEVPEPEGDVMVTFIDFGITVEGNLTAGDHLFRVENLGAQPHFLVLLKVPDGVTNDDLAALLASDMTGTPAAVAFNPETDFVDAGFTPTQSIGTVTWHQIPLEAGTYAGLCFFPTAGEGLPHAYHGMHTVFTVS